MKLYEEVTERILRALRSGTAPWVKPWGVPLPYNAATGRRYSGVNIILLWDTLHARPAWITWNQAKLLDAHVKKEEHATRIVYASTITKVEEDEERAIPFLKYYYVFNVEQVDGLPEHCYAVPKENAKDSVSAFLTGTGANVRHGGTRAFYSPGDDLIQMPHPEHFVTAEHYDATLLHEHVHWTGHPSRLARDIGRRFGDSAYAFEELVAELGAAFLSAELGMPSELHHADYIGSWVKLLSDYERAIFSAARKATEAADYLRAFTCMPPMEVEA
jgi:antirestriction protein ArdC